VKAAAEGDIDAAFDFLRARLVTSPWPTGSLTLKTIGIVEVALFAASAPGVVPVTITSTLRLTRSAANAGSRS